MSFHRCPFIRLRKLPFVLCFLVWNVVVVMNGCWSLFNGLNMCSFIEMIGLKIFKWSLLMWCLKNIKSILHSCNKPATRYTTFFYILLNFCFISHEKYWSRVFKLQCLPDFGIRLILVLSNELGNVFSSFICSLCNIV